MRRREARNGVPTHLRGSSPGRRGVDFKRAPRREKRVQPQLPREDLLPRRASTASRTQRAAMSCAIFDSRQVNCGQGAAVLSARLMHDEVPSPLTGRDAADAGGVRCTAIALRPRTWRRVADRSSIAWREAALGEISGRDAVQLFARAQRWCAGETRGLLMIEREEEKRGHVRRKSDHSRHRHTEQSSQLYAGGSKWSSLPLRHPRVF